jgi:CheY-like chemotaxis protein
MGGTPVLRRRTRRLDVSRLVACAAASDPPSQRGAVASEPRARILVVDDEPLIGNTIRRILSTYEVVAVTDAREALGRVRAGERFDLVLCDLSMPEMSGMDLHAAIVHDVPPVARRMAFITGGAYTDRAREFLARADRPQIAKPFTPATLRDAVRLLLADLAAAPA